MNATWGEKTLCVDYSAQAVQIGNLHFSVVDLGGAITLSLSTQNALRTPSREEMNQCVLLHLAAFGEWKNQGCPKRAPHKTRVAALAGHFRQYEYQQAFSFINQIKKPTSQREYELWSVAHDAMMANHDRQFREIPASLTGILNLGKCDVLRIFEIETISGEYHVSVRQFGEGPDDSVDTDMTLMVYEGHMRMLLPTSETTPKEWNAWRTYVHRVLDYEWIGWEKILASDETAPSFFTLEPCAVCGQKARLPNHTCFNPIGGESNRSSLTEGEIWWDNWNPWIYQKPTQPFTQPMPFCHMNRNPVPYYGLGELSLLGQKDMGIDFTPACDHWWRKDGNISPLALSFFEGVDVPYTPLALGALAKRGDELIISLNGLYPHIVRAARTRVTSNGTSA